jgi:hypothetical protein
VTLEESAVLSRIVYSIDQYKGFFTLPTCKGEKEVENYPDGGTYCRGSSQILQDFNPDVASYWTPQVEQTRRSKAEGSIMRG